MSISIDYNPASSLNTNTYDLSIVLGSHLQISIRIMYYQLNSLLTYKGHNGFIDLSKILGAGARPKARHKNLIPSAVAVTAVVLSINSSVMSVL